MKKATGAPRVEPEQSERAEFILRGLAAREEVRRNSSYIGADEVLARLQNKLAQAKAAAGSSKA